MKKSRLFSPFTLGKLTLSNRVVMSPMTRNRATSEHVPTELMTQYYEQRAGAGLIITEGVAPCANGLGYPRIPGIYSTDQCQAWKKVTQAVHQKGGHIFVQLMHTGRVSHPLNMPAGAKILAPSAVAVPGEMWTDQEGKKSHPVPTTMTEAEILQTINEYSHAAKVAIEAGFDGVELHGANGYLIDQFLNTASNLRTDQWGGSIDNRIRFGIEVAKAVTRTIGADRVGIRLSPFGVFNGMAPDAAMNDLYAHLSMELSKLKLTYIHIVDHSSMGAPAVGDEVKATIRDLFKGVYILSGGYDLTRAESDLEAKKGDLVAFGRPFIANPNLVEKLQKNLPLIQPDFATFYTPGEKGYTDYA